MAYVEVTYTATMSVYVENLTKKEVEILVNECSEYNADNIRQIDKAIPFMKFYLCNDERNKEKKITYKQANGIVCKDVFLSLLDRAAFHRDAVHSFDDGSGDYLYVDARKFFKQ